MNTLTPSHCTQDELCLGFPIEINELEVIHIGDNIEQIIDTLISDIEASQLHEFSLIKILE